MITPPEVFPLLPQNLVQAGEGHPLDLALGGVDDAATDVDFVERFHGLLLGQSR